MLRHKLVVGPQELGEARPIYGYFQKQIHPEPGNVTVYLAKNVPLEATPLDCHAHLIKALGQNKDFLHAVAPSTRNRRIVTARARVGIRRGNPVEIPLKY